MGAAAPASLRESAPETQLGLQPESQPETHPQTPQPETHVATASAAAQPIANVQSAVLQALSDGNQRVLASMLEAGEWSVQANELVIKVAESQTIVDMSLGSDAKRLTIAAASGVLGRAMKVKVVPGAAATSQQPKRNGTQPHAGPSGRNRAEQDAVVRRLQEKFGAQIRTVIDHKDKR